MSLSDMTPAELRSAGTRLYEWIADFRDTIREREVTARTEVLPLSEALPARAPESGESWDSVFDDFQRMVLPRITHWNHPRNFGYFNSSGSGPGILGETLSAALNVNAMTWLSSPAATELEEVVLGWLRQALGLPEQFRGVIFEGGSVSSFHALAAARERALRVRYRGLHAAGAGAIYRTAHAHSSIDKGVIALGMGLDSVREVPVDDAWRMSPAALDSLIAEDVAAGVTPVAVIVTAGTTSAAATDPIAAVADVCARHGTWLHVDAAYGGSAAILPEVRKSFSGWERADSIAVNPHKWLFVPLDLGVLLMQDQGQLRSAFSLVPEYLKDRAERENTDFMDMGVPLGRRFRALKLWFVMRHFGLAGLRAIITNHLELVRWFAAEIGQDPDFEIVAPQSLALVCFRYRPAGVDDEEQLEDANRNLLLRIQERGRVFLTHTKLDGRFVLRLSVGQVATEREDVEAALTEIKQCIAGLR